MHKRNAESCNLSLELGSGNFLSFNSGSISYATQMCCPAFLLGLGMSV